MISRIACVGGGPGGLFFAILIKQAVPSIDVTVFERNGADDTFGFGVVFSAATQLGIHEADPVLLKGLAEHGRRWDEIEVRAKGERIRCGGNGMAAIHRRTLLELLQRRAIEVGVELRFNTEVSERAELDGYDLVVAADGANSRFRNSLADAVAPRTDVASTKFIWFGTNYMFDGLTFVYERGSHGAFGVHAYPISSDISTFVVETDEQTWRAAGLDAFDVNQPPGPSDEKSKAYLENLFADQIDGRSLLVNNSRWGTFRTLRTTRWHDGNVVLLGDSAHTAHFSIGSGTKMAMEDGIALAASITEHPGDLDAALAHYEEARRPSVEKIQGAARPSLSWWEHLGLYNEAFEPTQFAFHFLSRSIGKEKLAQRDSALVAQVDRDWQNRHGGAAPLESALQLGTQTFHRRLVRLEDRPTGPVVVDDGGAALRLSRDAGSGEWGISLEAPREPAELPGIYERLEAAATGAQAPVLVAVHGGTPLTRALLAERARLVHSIPSLIMEPAIAQDRAETLVLSGRADLVCSLEEQPAKGIENAMSGVVGTK